MSPDPFDLSQLRAALRTARLGHTIEYVARTTSTNDYALDLANRGAADGTVVLADEQTAGRGRLGRSWDSPPGVGIWTSLILRPAMSSPSLPSLTLCAALAVAMAVHEVSGVAAAIKWPNDVVMRGRKVAGLLAETKTVAGMAPTVIFGIGINVNHDIEGFPGPLRETATSIRIETGRLIPRQSLFQCLLEQFEPLYRQFLRTGLAPLLPELIRHSTLLNRVVEVSDGPRTIIGTAVGLDTDGGLLIDTGEQGRVSVHSGTVRAIDD